MEQAAQAWYADNWGAMSDASAAAIDDAVDILEDMHSAVAGFRDARRLLLDAAHLHAGIRLLELGCGAMPQLAETAALVGRDGHITGLDNTESFLRLARERARRLGIEQALFQQGDCRALPFADEAFDAVLADKLLIHVGPGEVIVREMLRVTAPCGWIGALDWDGEAVMIAAENQRVTRRILDVNRDQRACFDAARRAAGWFAYAGAVDITVTGALACFTDTTHPLMQALLRRWADRAVAATAVRPEEAMAWLADVLAPGRQGALLAMPIIVTAGRKPENQSV